MTRITRPFEFASKVGAPSLGWDAMALANLALLLVFFAMFGSRFVVAPGVTVNLPTTQGETPNFVSTSRVLTVGEVDGRETLFFDGKVLNLRTLQMALEQQPVASPEEVMLVRFDRGVTTQLQVKVLEIARRAGFKAVQIASEPEPAKAAGFNE